LLEGLRSDEIERADLVANAETSLGILYELRSGQPISELRNLLREKDTQASFAAVILLAHYQGPSVQRDISDTLLTHLADDHHIMNQYAAFRALRELGHYLRSPSNRVPRRQSLTSS